MHCSSRAWSRQSVKPTAKLRVIGALLCHDPRVPWTIKFGMPHHSTKTGQLQLHISDTDQSNEPESEHYRKPAARPPSNPTCAVLQQPASAAPSPEASADPARSAPKPTLATPPPAPSHAPDDGEPAPRPASSKPADATPKPYAPAASLSNIRTSQHSIPVQNPAHRTIAAPRRGSIKRVTFSKGW